MFNTVLPLISTIQASTSEHTRTHTYFKSLHSRAWTTNRQGKSSLTPISSSPRALILRSPRSCAVNQTGYPYWAGLLTEMWLEALMKLYWRCQAINRVLPLDSAHTQTSDVIIPRLCCQTVALSSQLVPPVSEIEGNSYVK